MSRFYYSHSEVMEMGANINCYAATTVTALDPLGHELSTYPTTSKSFTVNIDGVHPEVKWNRVTRKLLG